MLANPHEYREMLWQALHDGELSPEMQAKADKNRADAAKSAVGKAPPRSAREEMEAMLAQAAEMRGETLPDDPERIG
jgi:hypothetical protein